MLTELFVENFAIIECLHLKLDAGFTVITGETGAGKSIIVDALQTVLGARTTGEVVRTQARTANIEAIFEWPDDVELCSFLHEHGIDEDSCLILRREINSSGRGSTRINGRAVPLAIVSSIGNVLVDIHGQSDHLSVLRHDRQLDLLDRFGGLMPLRADVATAVKEFGRLKQQLDEMTLGRRAIEQRIDLLRFQVQEIDSALLRVSEESDLATERNLLVNAEKIAALARSIHQSLQGGAGSALDQVADALSAVRELREIDPTLIPLAERMQDALYELEDIAQEMRRHADTVEIDPQRLVAIEDRLDLIARLKRKYGTTLQDVLSFGEQARADLLEAESIDQRTDALTAARDVAEERAGQLAEHLSMERARVARALTDQIQAALKGLGLLGTDFSIEITRRPDAQGLRLPTEPEPFAFSHSGVDSISFLVAFNPGEEPRALERVASGGETARFLLAVKSVLAEADRTPTLVFDEVDVGVGGRHGTVVGERLRHLAQQHQVISITHLPQVAALGNHHLNVGKVLGAGRTTVVVRELNRSERVRELAEMMSGRGTEAARRNAAELLEAAEKLASGH